jgi:hypothetical protein
VNAIDRLVPSAWKCALLAAVTAAPLAAQSASGSEPAPTRFVVRVENVSKPSTLKLPSGGSVAVPVSPGVWAVHTGANPIFTPGELEHGRGLKGLAEAGMAREFAANLRGLPGVRNHGAFETPLAPLVQRGGMARRDMAAPPAPSGAARSPASRMLQPGHRFEFTVEARPGDRLSIALMVAQSNDGLLATGRDGIALFDAAGRPVAGNVTEQLALWDAGTEVNEEPGIGRNQGLRQGAPHAGDPERRPVRLMSEAEFGDRWPPVPQLIRVTIAPETRR